MPVMCNSVQGMDTAAERLLDLVRNQGLIRPRDLAPLGIPRVSLTRAVRRGQLERIGRGLYGLPGRPVSAHGALTEVASRVQKGVVCPFSALRFHGLTAQVPFEVWLSDRGRRWHRLSTRVREGNLSCP